MEKTVFMRAIATAKELEIATLYQYWSKAMTNLIFADTTRQMKEITHLKCAYTEAIMDSRDTRVRIQRDLAKLADIEIWEPENLTDDMRELMQDLRETIDLCKQNEVKYANARKELEEMI